MGTEYASQAGTVRAVPAAGRARPSWERFDLSGSALKWDWASIWNVRVPAAGTALAPAPPSLARASTHPRTRRLIPSRREPAKQRGNRQAAPTDPAANEQAGRPTAARKPPREPTAAPAGRRTGGALRHTRRAKQTNKQAEQTEASIALAVGYPRGSEHGGCCRTTTDGRASGTCVWRRSRLAPVATPRAPRALHVATPCNMASLHRTRGASRTALRCCATPRRIAAHRKAPCMSRACNVGARRMQCQATPRCRLRRCTLYATLTVPDA